MVMQNENKIDRALRIITGLILLGGGVAIVAPWTGTALNIGGMAIGMLGLILILSGIIGWCPFYTMCNFSTCDSQENETCCKSEDKTGTPKAA